MKQNLIDKIKAISKSEVSPSIANKDVIIYDATQPNNIIKNFDKFNKKPEHVNLSNLLYNEIFKDAEDIINAPIEAIRIILILLHQSNTVHFNQRNAPYTPSLFEDEFKNVKNAAVSFTIPNNIISPSRETKRIKEALDILNSDKTVRWIKTTDENGVTVDTKMRFIDQSSYSRGKSYIVINTYWLEKMANIENYNRVLFNLAYNVPNTKHVFFALWLNTIPMYKDSVFKKESYTSWTKLNLETLQKKFGMDGKDSDYINQKFLKPIQNKLFEFNDRSFAFHFENKTYYIVAIDVNNNKVIESLSPENVYKNAVKYAVTYLQRRHKVDKESLEHIENIYKQSRQDKELMEKAYNTLKKKVKEESLNMTSLIGVKFLDRWQKEIINNYKETEQFKMFPHGYPKVNTSN